MIEADGTFILFHFIHRTIHTIIGSIGLVMRQVVAANAGQCASHEWLVLFTRLLALYFILRLMVSVNYAINTLTLTWALLLIHFVMSWLLMSRFPNVRWLLSWSLTRVIWTQNSLRVYWWHGYVTCGLTTVVALKKRFWSVKTILIHLLGRGRSSHRCTWNSWQLLLSTVLVVNFWGDSHIVASLQVGQTTRSVVRILARIRLRICRIQLN